MLYRFERVAEALLRDIQRGVWPVGSHLPKSDDLCARFDVSRPTLYKALERLQYMGVLNLGVGKRPTVMALRPRSADLELVEIRETLQAMQGSLDEVVALLRKLVER